MNEEYRKLFDEVHASQRLQMEVLQMKEKQNNTPRRRLVPSALLAAILAALVLAGTTLAAVNGTLGDWFTKKWGEETGGSMTQQQAQVIDSLTQKVGESQTSGDVTVTVDSITVGSENAWILLRVEGENFSEQKYYDFAAKDLEITPDLGARMSAYGVQWEALQSDGSLMMLLEYSTAMLSGTQLSDGIYMLDITLRDLAEERQGGTKEKILQEGSWTFSIPLTVESLSPVIPIGSVVVEGEVLGEGADGALEKADRKMEIEELRLTATGLSYCATENWEILDVTAIFADGTEVVSRSGGGSRMEDGTWYSSHQWPVPIDVENVTALRIGETEIPVPGEGG